jgi:hypothetical protein
MMEINQIFNQFFRRITIVILMCLAWLISLSATPVHADGYYSTKDHKLEINQPYYSTKEHRIKVTEPAKPYYSTKERKQERIIKTKPRISEDYIELRKPVKEENLGNKQ